MLPYPSGTLHIGHVRNYSIGDALARYKWMRGFNVLHPMGWDAFGLPAENAAIANKRPPREWTLHNIAAMKKTHRRFGFSYDWDREVSTCEPEYYRWNQWFFLQDAGARPGLPQEGAGELVPEVRHRAGQRAGGGRLLLAPRRHAGGAARARAVVPARSPHYADELLDGHRRARRRLARARAHHAAQLDRPLRGRGGRFHARGTGEPIRVFTTRVDTIYGATCVILAPEHPLSDELLDAEGRARAKAMVDARAGRDPGDIEKEGFFTGHYAINPYNGEQVPIWVGNFVLMGYGTGAIMAVPAHDERDFEFCTQVRHPDPPGDPPRGRRSWPMRARHEEAPSPRTASWRTPASGPGSPAPRRAAA